MALIRLWMVVAATAVAAWSAGRAGAAPAEPAAHVIPILCCEPAAPGAVALKLVLLNAGRTFAADTNVCLRFEGPDGRPVECKPPGPRTLNIPVACARWAPDQVEIVRVGTVVLGAAAPKSVKVSSGMAGEPPVPLGTLALGPKGQVRFARAWLGGASAAGRVLVAGACPLVGDGSFVVKVAFFNCGQKLPFDYTAFLHFELAPTGEHLDCTTALGLYPASLPTDSATWTESDLAVVSFGPYQWPRGGPDRIYLRAGLYDGRSGNGARLPLAGPDDSGRALIGRLVRTGDQVHFERAPLMSEVAPWHE